MDMKYQNFKKLAGSIWKTDFERQGLDQRFNPVFYKIIGIESDEYNSILKYLVNKAKEFDQVIFFTNEIEMEADFDLISNLQYELNQMNLNDLTHADIVLFQNPEINTKFLDCLDTVVKLYHGKYPFKNNNLKIDFIIKMIIWVNLYIRPIETSLKLNICPKCIYYGRISSHEITFLHLLYAFGFDIIYINPLVDDFKDFPKMDFIDELIYDQIQPIGNILDRISNGKDLNLDISNTTQLMDEIQNNMFTNSGIYRPWQLKDYIVHPLKKKYTLFDLNSMIKEPAKVREGFQVNKNTVYIPNIFFQIDGMDEDINNYTDRLNLVTSEENKFFFDNQRGETIITHPISSEDKLQLVFCRIGNHQYDENEIKKLPFCPWTRYNDFVFNSLISAMNRFLKNLSNENILSDSQEFNIIGHIMGINEEIIKLLDNFDYSDKIPKIVIYLENENFIDTMEIYALYFIYELGFDIIIFNPSGLKSVKSIIGENNFSHARLDKMIYDSTYESVKSKKKAIKGFFKSLFS